MIADRKYKIFRFLVFLIYSQIFAGAETSLWHNLFGGIYPPAFWIMIIVYLALYRETIEGLVNLFFVSFSLSVYTSLPEGLLTLNALIIFASARFLKARVFLPTTVYYASTCAASVIGFSVIHMILSLIFERTPVGRPDLVAVFSQSIMTFIFSVPMFSLGQMTDHFLRDEAKEGWGGVGE